jgi:adenosylmethionine-8-amino-7-oxononanoate aminotransferase
MEELPGNVLPRRLDRPLPRAVEADGVWVTDSNGKRYLDASGGPLVVNPGHCCCSTGLAGTDGDALVIGPPFIIEPDDVDRVVDALGHTVESVLA